MKPFANFKSLRRVLILALLLPFSSASIAQVSGSTQFSKALQDAKNHASKADYDAAILETYTRSNMAWQMHAQCLQNIKEHVNDLGKDFSRLEALREEATPSQRAAIDRIDPLLRDMAADLTATIENLNHNKSKVNDPAFRSRIHDNWLNVDRVYTALCECTSKTGRTEIAQSRK